MKTLIANAKNDDYTGETTDLTIDINDGLATWKYNGYEFTIKVHQIMDRSKWDIKRNEAWISYTLDGDDWSDTLHNGHTCLNGFDGMDDNEIICSMVRIAHIWICNHI